MMAQMIVDASVSALNQAPQTSTLKASLLHFLQTPVPHARRGKKTTTPIAKAATHLPIANRNGAMWTHVLAKQLYPPKLPVTFPIRSIKGSPFIILTQHVAELMPILQNTTKLRA